jgi:hypothetical protein
MFDTDKLPVLAACEKRKSKFITQSHAGCISFCDNIRMRNWIFYCCHENKMSIVVGNSKELRVAISTTTPRSGKLCAEKQAHPSHLNKLVQPGAHEPLQITTLLESNIKLPCMLNKLHLTTNTAACL